MLDVIRRFGGNLLEASQDSDLSLFTSEVAIIIYVFVILAIIAVLVVAVIFTQRKDKNQLDDVASGEDVCFMPERDSVGKDEVTERFCMLSAIDRKRNGYGHASYKQNVTLEEFCDNFRNYAAYRHGLYYDIEDIRRFVAGMSVSHMLILQGMSGTGKTSLAHAIGSFVDNSSTIIPVQPMWKERTDLIGYYNEFTRRFNETLLLTKMYEANYSNDIYVTVLDEMNIARVEYYFAEFLSLLELPNPDERYLDVVSDKW